MDEAESFIVNEHEENLEFSNWVNLLLDAINEKETGNAYDMFDLTQTQQPPYYYADYIAFTEDAFYLKYSLEKLIKLRQSITSTVSDTRQISRYMLLDTGASKSICSDTWLFDLKWTPVQNGQLSPSSKPFRSAVHPFPSTLLAGLTERITDSKGNAHFIRQVTFILPSIPIPFLVGLQTQKGLDLDICRSKQNGIYVCVNS